MKKLFIAAMMCLMGVIAQAQVITSDVINALYGSATTNSESRFAYNADFDDQDNIVRMYVYNRSELDNGDVVLKPACQYEYDYGGDGVLQSRTKYVWDEVEWQCAERLVFSLIADLYSVEYSRWNQEAGAFDEAVEKMSYTLHPDSSVHEVCRYLREQKGSPYQLSWHVSVTDHDSFFDDFLTER